MLVNLEWLKELVDLEGLSTKEIVDKLSLYSIEVESVNRIVEGTNLVIGHVEECVKHLDSDHLSICQVNVGNETLQIICGAPNIKKGLNVIVALNGALLPNGIKIKKSKIRGVESNGMICSLQEIGMEKKYIADEYQNGIYYFKDEVEIGGNPLKALELDTDIIELGLTPNRGDLLSMLGVAYEVSAILNRPLKKLTYDLSYTNEYSKDYIKVINESKDCYLYKAQIVKDITIKSSPQWLNSRLIAFGIRPINNVVDITNYILALFGQPLHAFDYDKLGNTILIRNANKDETIITLDDIERSLEEEDVVITDGENPIAIAGVMGGRNTEITNHTKNIVIEAAVFNPVSIRKTSLRLGLRSESSIRFEKIVDINRTELALNYTNYLLQKYADAKIMKDALSEGINKVEDTSIELSEDDVKKYLGIAISKEEIKSIFKRLGFAFSTKGNNLIIKVPNRRNEIKIKADLIEEIVRIYGYDKLPETIPYSDLVGTLTNIQKKRRLIKNCLVGLGLNEVINYSLVSDKQNELFKYNQVEKSKDITLLMPLSAERKNLRRSLLQGLVENAKYNFSRKIFDLALFEVGKVYYNKNDENHEDEVLSILMSNKYTNTLWKGETQKVDFYLLKGLLDLLFAKLKVEVTYKPVDLVSDQMHPKRSAFIYYNNNKIGYIGELHPKYSKENDLHDIYVAEIMLNDLLSFEPETTRFMQISKTPTMERDIALVIDKDVLAADIITTIRNTDKKLLKDAEIFDVYTGKNVDDGKLSIAIKLTFSSFDTLTDEVVNKKVNKIVSELNNKFNAVLRS